MPHGHHHHQDDDQKLQAWQAAWAHAFFDNPDEWLAAADKEALRRSFGNHGGVLMCIDEGVEPGEGADAVYLAGSGILYKKGSLATAAERRAQLVEHLKGKGVTGVTSHTSCGACALYCSECGEGEPEETSKEWAQRLAADLAVPYVEHVTNLRRPGFHDALTAYYDGTGRFMDPSRAGLPKGFIVSRALIPDAAHAAYELDLASQIAMGAHGFGDMFTAEKPFHFVVVTDENHPELTEEMLLNEIRPIVDRKPQTKLVVLRMPN